MYQSQEGAAGMDSLKLRSVLTHLPLVLHICVNRVSIGSDNGLSPIRRQAII